MFFRRFLIAILVLSAGLMSVLPITAQEDDVVCEGLVLIGTWSRPALSMDGTGNGATFLAIVNPGIEDDVLISASSQVASVVELHETSMTDEGVMQMRQVEDGIPIPAGGATMLQPGGYHVMLIGLNQDLIMDESFEVTLSFENAGDVTITPVPSFDPPQEDAITITTVGELSGCPPLGMYGAWTEADGEHPDVYGLLLNRGDEPAELISASSPIAAAATLMGIYEGIEPMEVENITIPANGVVMLNDTHLFVRLADIETMPDMFELTLSFADGDELTVMVTVHMPMMSDGMMDHDGMEGESE